jgi:hypothetical protein
MYDPDVVSFGQLVQRGVAKPCSHQAATEEDNGIAVWISKVGIGKPMGVVATCFRGRRKDVASVEASVREKLKYFGCRYMQAHVGCVCVGIWDVQNS